MGLDIVSRNGVVLYGAPRNILDFTQEIGRVGRDGNESAALVLYNSHSVRIAEKDVKQF